jgi:hypothetical protein
MFAGISQIGELKNSSLFVECLQLKLWVSCVVSLILGRISQLWTRPSIMLSRLSTHHWPCIGKGFPQTSVDHIVVMMRRCHPNLSVSSLSGFRLLRYQVVESLGHVAFLVHFCSLGTGSHAFSYSCLRASIKWNAKGDSTPDACQIP